MGDFSAKAMLRFALISNGISFDDLDPTSAIWGGGGPTLKGHAERVMFAEGISVQELKKGSFYEIAGAASPICGGDDLPKKNFMKEKTDMWAETRTRIAPAAASPISGGDDLVLFGRKEKNVMKEKKETFAEYMEAMKMEAKKKDIEMYGDLDAMPSRERKKILKNIQKIEKQKIIKFLADQEKICAM